MDVYLHCSNYSNDEFSSYFRDLRSAVNTYELYYFKVLNYELAGF